MGTMEAGTPFSQITSLCYWIRFGWVETAMATRGYNEGQRVGNAGKGAPKPHPFFLLISGINLQCLSQFTTTDTVIVFRFSNFFSVSTFTPSLIPAELMITETSNSFCFASLNNQLV